MGTEAPCGEPRGCNKRRKEGSHEKNPVLIRDARDGPVLGGLL